MFNVSNFQRDVPVFLALEAGICALFIYWVRCQETLPLLLERRTAELGLLLASQSALCALYGFRSGKWLLMTPFLAYHVSFVYHVTCN